MMSDIGNQMRSQFLGSINSIMIIFLPLYSIILILVKYSLIYVALII